MKKILMLVLVLSAAGAYSQEIRMPDEKRKDYVDERKTDKTATDTKKMEQRDIEEERRKRAELARKQRAAASDARAATKGKSVYCIIQEMAEPGARKSKVIIQVEENFEGQVKKMDDITRKEVMIAVEKRGFTSGLDALSVFTQSNWTLLETSTYSFNEMAVREYLMEYQLSVR